VGLLIALVSALAAYTISGTSPTALARGGEPQTALRVPGTESTTGGTDLSAESAMPPSSTITLITGDRVRLDVLPDGQQTASVLMGASGTRPGSSAFVEFTYAGDEYVVPDAAVPYLGSALDPRLFDVSYLVRAGLADARASALPVSITYPGGVARPGLPGLHITHMSGRTAYGTIAKADTGLLGELLASQWRSARAGHSLAQMGGLPGVQRVGLAPPAGAPALPSLPSASTIRHGGSGIPYRTLTLKFTDLNGRPAAALGFVQDVGNANLALFMTGGKGSESVSVPEGTYSLEFSVLTPHSSGSGFDTALMVKPQLAVHSDETVRLDARTARPFRVTLRGTTAPPVQEDVLDYTRSSQTGGELSLDPRVVIGLGLVSLSRIPAIYRGVAASELLATPTATVTKGTFGFHAYSFFSSKALGTGAQSAQPTYFLSFPDPGRIPGSLTYQVPATDLTTVHEQLYDPAGTPLSACGYDRNAAGMIYTLYDTWDDSLFWIGDVTPLGERTDYWYTSEPRLELWQAAYNDCDRLRQWGPIERISPGQQISESWDKGPMVPSPAAPPAYASDAHVNNGVPRPLLTVCPACRQGNIGMLNLLPFGDSDPSQYAEDFGGDSSLLFYRDGRLAYTSASAADGGHMVPFAFNLPMLPGAAAYRLDWLQTDPGQPGAYDDTDWAFRSAPADADRRPAASEECAPDPTQGCSFLPLLFINYDLKLGFHSRAEAGKPFRIAFTVGHQQNEDAPAGLAATVSISYNDGKTWTAPHAATRQGSNMFSLTIDQPPLDDTSGFVSLRVTAHDCAGNSVVQTIIRAYGLND
jgi:hypothetical protein